MAGAKAGGSPGLVFWEWLVAAYALGVLFLRYPSPVLVAGAILAVVFMASHRPDSRPVWTWALLPLCALAGFTHASVRLPGPPADIPQFILDRREVRLSGLVDEVVPKPGGRLEIRLQDTRWTGGGESGTLPGRIVWTWDKATARPRPGDRVRIEEIRIKPVRGFVNPGVWSYRFYRRLQGIFYRTYTRADEKQILFEGVKRGPPGMLRERFRSVLGRYGLWDGPGRGLPAALTMGDRSGLTHETVNLFRRASLAHSLALSGMHLGFVASLGFGLAWLAGAIRPEIYLRMPRPKLAVLAAAPLIVFYVWLGGFSPSLVRSAIMFASFGVMLMLGRGRVLVDGLFAALALILIVSPLAAYDIRLQFSAVAVGGILVLFPIGWRYVNLGFEAVRERRRGPGPLPAQTFLSRIIEFLVRGAAACLLVSVCANLALMPLVAWNFGVLSANPLPNLFWLPLMGGAVLPLSLLGMILGAIPFFEPVGGAMLHAASWISSWGVSVIGLADRAGLVGETVPIRPAWGLMLGYYALILGGAVLLKGRGTRISAAVLTAGLILVVAPGLAREWPLSGGALSISALDTGQSQAVAVDFPDGSRAIVDGGGTWSGNFDMGRAVTAPFLAANRPPILDFMVMTHSDLDHSKGLVFPLRHFRVGLFAHNGRPPDGEDFAEAVAAYGRVPKVWQAGDVIKLGHETVIEVLHPPEGFEASGENDHSLTLRIVWRGRGMVLLPGDVEEPAIRALLDSGRDLSARLLIVPHHGGKCELTAELLNAVRPELAVACAGFLNYRRLPHREVRKSLAEAGVKLMVTGEEGWIRARWDGPESPPSIESMSLREKPAD